MNYQTVYDFLSDKKQSGELAIWFSIGLLPTHITQWLDIYDYHCENPELSQLKVAHKLHASRKTIWRAYKFMEQALN